MASVLQPEIHELVEQKNFAIEQAAHDWVLCVDADERVTPELKAQIEQEQEKLAGRAGKLTESLARKDLVVLDEVGNLVGVCRYRKVSVEGDDSPTRQLTFQS